ncbi:hypothetical protein SC763_14545 [Legionella pneumophila serogroup 1]
MCNFFNGVINFVDAHQGWLTVALFVFGFYTWKRTHIRERESNYYVDILEKIIALRYLVLEVRQPRFLPRKLDQDYVEQNNIPSVNTIINHSYTILKSLSSREEIVKNKYFQKQVLSHSEEKTFGNSNYSRHKKLTRLYRDKISIPIIKEMSLAITLFLHGAGDKEMINIFFPSENKNSRGKYETDDTGLHIFNDEFNKMMIANFRTVISQIEKFII